MKPFHLVFTLLTFSLMVCAQNDEVIIKTVQLSDHIYMLEGQGGNIGVSIGDDGVLMIDSQFAQLTPKLLEAIRTLSDKPLKYLVNTHHHGDHTGGNANIAKHNATIIAHDNVRKHLLVDNKNDKLPAITFNDKLSLYINGEQVVVMHFDNAHTNGDSMLYFTESNVLHTGDIFFAQRYPYIDLNSGGSVNGYIEAVKSALILIDENTKIIPGHGEASNKKSYQFFLSMLEDLKTTVLAEIKTGKSEEEVVNNTNLTKTYDDLGYSWNFISSEKIRRTFYRSLKANG
ncbi:MBL fold metallo-hydrolase [Aestuariivivens insulae]|uniref:MBL fold metallo-hydrolase n=1 Tax=Aestuariivivens insulae TaxID=1621988 RepID=UPI001F57F28D|nr:MBL fold metallo-hydrolase [Aestuariivivens insulae]